jgi:hypothetical protein
MDAGCRESRTAASRAVGTGSCHVLPSPPTLMVHADVARAGPYRARMRIEAVTAACVDLRLPRLAPHLQAQKLSLFAENRAHGAGPRRPHPCHDRGETQLLQVGVGKAAWLQL